MGEGHNFRQLRAAILALSEAKDWDVARKEWSLVNIYEAEEPETCLCGHTPIIEICCLLNKLTKKRTEVGNQCVKRFLGFRSDKIFSAIKRIRKDITKSLNEDAIVFFRARDLLNDWEYSFSQNTLKKRNMTPTQMTSRQKINEKVLAAVSRRGFRGPD